jgi:hypothetical protein
MVDKDLKRAIVQFRKEIWSRDFGDSLFGPSAILSDAAVDSLSSFGHIDRLVDLENALGGFWAWFDKYGDELLTLFQSLDVAPKKARPARRQAAKPSKRAVEGAMGDEEHGREEQRKRQRVETGNDVAGMPPTPVHPRPGLSTSLPPSTPSTPFITPAQQVYGYPRPIQAAYSSPLAHNPYASLATPPLQYYQTPQTPYLPIPFPYSHYYPANISSSSSQQVPDRYNIPHQYPRFPPGPPPAPPST